MSDKGHYVNQSPERAARRFREAFPELCEGKTDQELISRLAEVERKYGHLTLEERCALLTPENKQKLIEKIDEMLERQKREGATV